MVKTPFQQNIFKNIKYQMLRCQNKDSEPNILGIKKRCKLDSNMMTTKLRNLMMKLTILIELE
jgi:hypothetical protein